MTITSPFAAVINEVEERESRAAVEAQQAREAADKLRLERAEKAKAEQKARRLIDFGNGFLRAVIKTVVRKDRWGSAYIRDVEAYSVGLLSLKPVDLPKIDPRHAQAILEKFEFGLELSQKRGFTVAAGTFYGQQLLADE